jgi:hypothetical protein
MEQDPTLNPDDEIEVPAVAATEEPRFAAPAASLGDYSTEQPIMNWVPAELTPKGETYDVAKVYKYLKSNDNALNKSFDSNFAKRKIAEDLYIRLGGFTQESFNELMSNPDPKNPITPEMIIAKHTGLRDQGMVANFFEGIERGLIQGVTTSTGGLAGLQAGLRVPGPPLVKAAAATTGLVVGSILGAMGGETIEYLTLPTTGIMPDKEAGLYAGKVAGNLIGATYPSTKMMQLIPGQANLKSAAVSRFFSNLKSQNPDTAGWVNRFRNKLLSFPGAATKFGEEVLSTAGKSAREKPITFMAEQLPAIPWMTGVAGVAEAVAPESTYGKEAAVFASGFVSPTRIFSAALSAGTSKMGSLRTKFTQAGKQDAASLRLIEFLTLAEKDPEAAFATLATQQLVDREGNLIKLSPGQMLGKEFPGILALEKMMGTSNAQLGVQFAEASKSGIAKIDNLIKLLRETNDPQALQLAAEIKYQKIAALIRGNVESKVANVQNAAEAVTKDPAEIKAALDKILANSPDMPRKEAMQLAKQTAKSRPRVDANKLIRDTTKEAISDWRKAEKAAYDAVDWTEDVPAENLARLWTELTSGERKELPTALAPFRPWLRDVLPTLVKNDVIDDGMEVSIKAAQALAAKSGVELNEATTTSPMANEFIGDYLSRRKTGGVDTTASDGITAANKTAIEEKWNFIKKNFPQNLTENPGSKARQVAIFEDAMQPEKYEVLGYPLTPLIVNNPKPLTAMEKLAEKLASDAGATDDPVTALQDLLRNPDAFEGLSNASKKEIINLTKMQLKYLERNRALGDLRGKAAAGRSETLEVDAEDPMTSYNMLQKLRSHALTAFTNARAGNADWGDAAIWSKIAEAADNDLGTVAKNLEERLRNGEVMNPNQQALIDAHAISKAGNDVFTKTFAGDMLKTDTTRSTKLAPELMHEKLFSGSGDAVALRFNELSEAAAFAANASGNNALARANTLNEAYESLLRVNAGQKIFDQVQVKDPITGQLKFNKDGSPIYKLAINETKLKAFNDEYAGILDVPAMSALKADLQSAQKTQYILDAAKRRAGSFWNSVKAESGFAKLVDVDGFGRQNAGNGIAEILSTGNARAENQFESVMRLVTKEKDPVRREVSAEGLRTSIMAWAINGSTVDGVVNPKKLKALLFDPVYKERPSVLSMMRSKGIIGADFNERLRVLVKAMDSIHEQMTGGSFSIELFQTDPGYKAIAQLIGADLAKRMVPIGGSIQTPQIGSSLAVQMLDKQPNIFSAGIIREALKPGNKDFFEMLVRRGEVLKNAQKESKDVTTIQNFFRKVFGAPILSAPAAVSAATAISPINPTPPQGDTMPERPKPLTQPVSSAPPALPRPEPSLPPSSQQSAMTPPPAPRPAAQSPQTRSQYSALFPNDMLSPMINSQQGGITSLMG